MRFTYVIFFILLICVLICYNYNTIYGGVAAPLIASVIGGCQSTFKNVLIIDIANIFTGWYMENHGNKQVPYFNQPNRLRKYLECASDHYKHFTKHNNGDANMVNYVIKNYRHTQAVGKHDYSNYMPKLTEDDWNLFHEFVRERKQSIISVAIDYRIIPLNKWKDKKMHYLRGRDDYLCFNLAKSYKKKYINSVIMSEDKYKDYQQFGYVPEFRAYYIQNIGGDVVQTDETISPRPNILGQIKDYKLVKITTEFDFTDLKFMKTNDYKIAKPGHVWK